MAAPKLIETLQKKAKELAEEPRQEAPERITFSVIRAWRLGNDLYTVKVLNWEAVGDTAKLISQETKCEGAPRLLATNWIRRLHSEIHGRNSLGDSGIQEGGRRE